MSLSFGFKKKIESKVVNIDKPKEEQTDFVKTVEGKVIKSSQQKEAAKELVIPLIRKNVYHLPIPSNKKSKNEKEQINEADAAAAKEIMEESKSFMENIDNTADDFDNLAVPLLLKNKVPEGFETDDRLDVSLRPDEASEAQYDQIPVSAFGMAVLRGMGWTPDEGIGKTFKQNTKMLEQQVRPKGLGLGANVPKPLNNGAGDRHSVKSKNSNNDEDSLALCKGANVLIHSGSLKNKYGVILGIDIETARCFVKLAIGGKSEQVGQHCLRVVSKKEYDKNAKDLSKFSKAYKGENMGIIGSERKNGNRQTPPNDDTSNGSASIEEKSRSFHKDHKRRMGDENMKRRRKDQSPEIVKHKKHKKSKSHKSSDLSQKKEKNHSMSWVRPQMRVRIIDKSYKKGRYYREKLIVEDVLGMGICSCKTDDGKILDDIEDSMLETVIPKSTSDAYVIIVKQKSKHNGKLAKILEKDKNKCVAHLQLIEDRDVVVLVGFEEMCEFTGDPEAYAMF